MCDFHQGFKLCTCDGEQLLEAEIDWKLNRINKSIPIKHRRGRAAIPRFTNQEQTTKESILEFLNLNNCFDFDYEPQENDFLRIRIHKKNDRWAAFRFVRGTWTDDKSTSLSSWRSQLVKFEKGKLKQD